MNHIRRSRLCIIPIPRTNINKDNIHRLTSFLPENEVPNDTLPDLPHPPYVQGAEYTPDDDQGYPSLPDKAFDPKNI
jgi:hypothetical protein